MELILVNSSRCALLCSLGRRDSTEEIALTGGPSVSTPTQTHSRCARFGVPWWRLMTDYPDKLNPLQGLGHALRGGFGPVYPETAA